MGTHPTFSPSTGPSASYQPKTTDESDNTVAGTVVPHVNVGNFPSIQAVSGTVTATVAFPTTQQVAGTVALGTGVATIGSIANLFALDATIVARLGTLGQKPAASSTPVVIASDQGPLATAPAAGENHIGSVGSDSKRVVGIPTLTPGTYASGKCLGGLMTLSSLLRVAGKAATIQSASIHAKIANTAQIDIVLFRDTPSVTAGLADNATFSVDPADFDKVSKVISFTVWNSFGTPSLSRIDGIGSLVSTASGLDMKAILVARGSVTISTASDLSATLGVYQD